MTQPDTLAAPGPSLLARRILHPLERFLHIEAASGFVLLAAAAIALMWANSPWAAAYARLWHVPVTLGLGGWDLSQDLHFWINEGLMTVFFLVVGLEIRRELHGGALANFRLAALPAAAALGGVIAPALIYIAFNASAELQRGWAIPTATDIAFAVGVLTLLGRRVPAGLRALLLALAIIDDVAAVLIIAIFYSQGVALSGLWVAAGGVAGVWLFQKAGIRSAWAYVIPGGVLWFGMIRAGVHPALAGAILGLMTPVVRISNDENVLAFAARALDEFRDRLRRNRRDTEELLRPMQQLRDAQRELLPPVVRVQAALHPWVAFGIMPLFAFANAGVSFEAFSFEHGDAASLVIGIVLALVVGKPLGIVLAAWLSVKLRLCALPEGITWRDMLVMGCLGGIGFTMSIFIAALAFPDNELLAMAKLAVLVASTLAAAAGLMVGGLIRRPPGDNRDRRP